MTTHGHRRGRRSSRTYTSWLGMRQRCYNSSNPAYSNYGGAGIRVYFGWLGAGGFEEFLRDVGERPKRTTLDRIDPDGHYEPGNVRWASISVQNSNKSGYMHELNGERFTVYQKAKELGMHPGAVRKRISRLMARGYTEDESRTIAFTRPKRGKK